MIRRLRIENFRGIGEGELELFPLTILLGANNSGKTAVLEALLLAHGPAHRQPYPDIRSWSSCSGFTRPWALGASLSCCMIIQLKKFVNLLLLVDRELPTRRPDRGHLKKTSEERGRLRRRKDEDHIKEAILLKNKHEVRLLVVISDMGREDIIKHSIEEHLLLVAEDILGTDHIINMIRRTGGDAKRAWNSLGKEEQHRVFRYLIAQPDAAERAFPQRLEALRELDD